MIYVIRLVLLRNDYFKSEELRQYLSLEEDVKHRVIGMWRNEHGLSTAFDSDIDPYESVVEKYISPATVTRQIKLYNIDDLVEL